jgi:hypothetical protein
VTLPIADFGGRYVARENADGTFSVLNVPIVGELAKGARKDYPDLEIDKAWLEAAHASLKAGEADGFLPPLNLHHHGTEKPVTHVGFVRPREVRRIKYRGHEMWALFADYDRVPREWADQIARGRLPYCSIEGPVKGPGDVKSLAMLTDEPPQFAFPIVTVGTVIPHMAADVVLPEPEGPWIRASSASPCFAFKFEGDGKDEEKAKGDDESESDESDDESDDEDENESEEESDGGIAECLALLRKLTAVLIPPEDAATASTDSTTGTRGPVGTQKTSGDQSGKETKFMATIDPKTEGKLAAMESEVASLKADKLAREKRDADAALATAAITALTAEGFSLSVEAKQRLGRVATFGKDALDEVVAVFKENASKDPPRTHAEAIGAGAPGSALATGDEAIVAKFSAAGPESGAVARKALREYRRQVAAGVHLSMTPERYVQRSIDRASVMAITSTADFDKDEE